MGKLIQPIEVIGGTYRCCQAFLFGTTETVPVPFVDPGETNNQWNALGQAIWNVMGGDTGGVAFGVCCASEIVLRIWGRMRILAQGEDDLQVYLNGVLVWQASADEGAGRSWYNEQFGVSEPDPLDTYPYYEGPPNTSDPAYQEYHILTLKLPAKACGDVIKFVGGLSTAYPVSGFSTANWRFRIDSLT